MELDLSTTIGGIPLSLPIWNASGVMCSTYDELKTVISSPYTGAVVTKSCTFKERRGNDFPRYSRFDNGSINSMGLPNKGLSYYLDCARLLSGSGKAFFLSLCGLTREENLSMLKHLEEYRQLSISGVELNLSCPNVVGKPQTCYDFEATDEMLRQSFEVFSKCPVGIKLSPYFDPIHFDMASDVFKNYPGIRWLTCINSIGNGLVVDVETEEPLIHPKFGLGGIGGSVVKATALANVRNFRQRFAEHKMDIVGCGGVTSGGDVFEHILCGASAVQIGTLIQEHGESKFQTCLDELSLIMRRKNYCRLSDFRGKLKAKAGHQPTADDFCLVK